MKLCFADSDTAFLQFYMNDRHSVDEQAEITSPRRIDAVVRLEFWLLSDLIPCPPSGNFISVKNFQRYGLFEIERILVVISGNLYSSAVNKTVQIQRSAK